MTSIIDDGNASDTGTIDITDLPPGPHKVRIDLVDGNHQLFPGQSKTVAFTVPDTAPHSYCKGEHHEKGLLG